MDKLYIKAQLGNWAFEQVAFMRADDDRRLHFISEHI